MLRVQIDAIINVFSMISFQHIIINIYFNCYFVIGDISVYKSNVHYKIVVSLIIKLNWQLKQEPYLVKGHRLISSNGKCIVELIVTYIFIILISLQNCHNLVVCINAIGPSAKLYQSFSICKCQFISLQRKTSLIHSLVGLNQVNDMVLEIFGTVLTNSSRPAEFDC